jgi:hypothetical protein
MVPLATNIQDDSEEGFGTTTAKLLFEEPDPVVAVLADLSTEWHKVLKLPEAFWHPVFFGIGIALLAVDT